MDGRMIREYLASLLSSKSVKPIDLSEARAEAKAVSYGTGSNFIPARMTGGLPSTKLDYQSAVGNGLGSSVLMSPVRWIQRTFPEAFLEVARLIDNTLDPIPNHPMVQLVNRPNDHYSGTDLWRPTLYSYLFDGNAYWRIQRNESSLAPEALWYVPHWCMQPRWNPGEFISWYDYTPISGQRNIRLKTDDVIHFRNGLDPRNARLGMSDVYSEFREIFGDDEAANFVASLLRNMGIPGIVLSPKGENTVIDNIDAVKQQLMEKFTGDNRGEPMVNGIAVDVQEFGFSPQKMDVGMLRDISEERVCAALGVPAAVVGFGSGLEQTKVGATMTALIKLAWQQRIIPDQAVFAETLTNKLLPEFEPRPDGMEVRFNRSQVQALRQDHRDLAEAFNIGISGGWVQVAEGREALGLPVADADRIYLRSMQSIPEPAGKHSETLGTKDEVEQRIIDNSERVRTNRMQRDLQVAMQRDKINLEDEFEPEIEGIFKKFGAHVADVALDVLEDMEPKASPPDEVAVAAILARLDDELLREELKDKGGAHYLRVAQRTYKTINVSVGLAVDLPNHREVEILKQGGRRLGLLELAGEKNSAANATLRRKLLNIIAEARDAHEGADVIARKIRSRVGGGRWNSPKIRSKVVARTETAHAQRQSQLEAYRDSGVVERVVVFDGTAGDTDLECEKLNGREVPIEEAFELTEAEHPNGTRSFSPIIA
jgi:HK97 family phage portal protein